MKRLFSICLLFLTETHPAQAQTGVLPPTQPSQGGGASSAPAPPAPQPSAATPAPAPGYPQYPPPYPYPYPPPQPGPKTLPYEEGQAVPPGYRVETGVRRGPVIAGAVMTGVPYILGVSFSGGAGFPNHTYWLRVPGAGPWLVLATRNKSCQESQLQTTCSGGICTTRSSSCDVDVDNVIRTFLILDGFIQSTGVALFIWGLASPTSRLVREDV